MVITDMDARMDVYTDIKTGEGDPPQGQGAERGASEHRRQAHGDADVHNAHAHPLHGQARAPLPAGAPQRRLRPRHPFQPGAGGVEGGGGWAIDQWGWLNKCVHKHIYIPPS